MTEEELWKVVDNWWKPANFAPPFTPGNLFGTNGGCVSDFSGNSIADTGGNEARADVIAALLNIAALRRNKL